jgi:type VI secretion system protein ImpG
MAIRGSEDLLPHYMAELDYLYTAGIDYAHKYPDVAAALEFSRQGSNDPHVQRLIESFAFLTARLQYNYDAQFPEIPAALLEILYPQLTAPVPSMSVAAFEVDPQQPASIAGQVVPAGSELYASAAPAGGQDLLCRFRTGYPVTLWPLEVVDAWIEPAPDTTALGRGLRTSEVQSALRVRLHCLGQRSFKEFAPPSLRFCLPATSKTREKIYELLFAHTRAIATFAAPLQPDAATQLRLLPGARLEPVGFGADEALLPCPPASHQAYRLLLEYFAFPDKFLFFDVTGLPSDAFGAGQFAELIFLLAAPPQAPMIVSASSFFLNCTPIINLFPRVTEPIRVNHQRLEYPLVADQRRGSTTEIHSIERVIRSVARAERGREVAPLFSIMHVDAVDSGEAMYVARRRPVADATSGGSDMTISFVDPNLDALLPAADVVFAHVLCTNRGLAEQIPGGAALDREVDLPARAVQCLGRPTRQLAPPGSGGTLWRLISHLSVNHLSLSGGEQGLAALRELLRLYCPNADSAAAARINGLTSLTTKRIVRHVGKDAWRGFCRGLEVELEFDEAAFAGASAFLMGSVLSRFFGLYVAVNSFTELRMRGRQQGETWRWQAQTGDMTLL